jgi:hypothetical protein
MNFNQLINILESQDNIEVKRRYWDNAKTRLASEIWYVDDEYHRLDGPAHQRWYENGQKESEMWRINGVDYTKEEFDEYTKGMNKEELDMLSDLGQTFD